MVFAGLALRFRERQVTFTGMVTEIAHAQDLISDKPSVSTPSSQPARGRQPVDSPSQNLTSAQSLITRPKLSHPPWVALISRIPRAARASSAALLSQIMRKIVASPNDTVAWHELLNFGPTILAKPKRGGSKRNLSDIINSRTIGCLGQRCDANSRSLHYTWQKAPRRANKNSRLASAVSSKLEAGNLRAAVRIVCSSDTLAPVNQDTLKALQAKHPGPAID